MAQQKIELRKVRDFSDNLNDTFLFLKQNLKPLSTTLLGITGVLILVTAILSGFYQSETTNIFDDLFSRRNTYSSASDFFGPLYFLLILFFWLTAVSFQVVIVAYMKVYEEKGNEAPTFEEVWSVFKANIIPLSLYFIPISILVLIGSVLCFLPGIYLATVFAPFAAIVIIEKETFSGAFNRCFTLVKDNFWLSLGIYVVIFLISWISSMVISLVVGIITGLVSYFTTHDIKSTIAIVSSILNVLGFIFYILLFISVTLNYYNLSERFDGTGILRKLETLGTDTATGTYNANAEEEY